MSQDSSAGARHGGIEDSIHLRLRAGILQREAQRLRQKAGFAERYAQGLKARAERLDALQAEEQDRE